MQIKSALPPKRRCPLLDITDHFARVRTLTGKEIELDIERDYKVRITHEKNPRPPTRSVNKL